MATTPGLHVSAPEFRPTTRTARPAPAPASAPAAPPPSIRTPGTGLGGGGGAGGAAGGGGSGAVKTAPYTLLATAIKGGQYAVDVDDEDDVVENEWYPDSRNCKCCRWEGPHGAVESTCVRVGGGVL
jgi:hypothetical protein